MPLKPKIVGEGSAANHERAKAAFWQFVNDNTEKNLAEILSSDEILIEDIMEHCRRTLRAGFEEVFEPAYTEGDIVLILDAIQSIVQERITTHMTRRDIAFWDYFKMHIDYQLGYQTSLPILKHKNKYPERPLDLKDYINRCRDALDITFMEIESDYKQFQEKNDHMANKVEAIIDEEMGLN